MSHNQYEIELEEDPSVYYVDQSIHNSTIGYRTITSAYTPYGIRSIDSEYCNLIRNLNVPVKQVYGINRRKYEDFCDIKTREVHMSFNYGTFYDPIELNSRRHEIRIEWINGEYRDFLYNEVPLFDLKSRMVNFNSLINSIKDNQHLHVKIKENLLSNLNVQLSDVIN